MIATPSHIARQPLAGRKIGPASVRQGVLLAAQIVAGIEHHDAGPAAARAFEETIATADVLEPALAAANGGALAVEAGEADLRAVVPLLSRQP